MEIVVGSDHAGYSLKKKLASFIRELGHGVHDVGTESSEPVDYPDIAEALGLSIIGGEAERGVLICGSGVGAAVAVNKMPGIRAGLCHDTYSAHQGVEHDDIHVLVLGARVIGIELAKELVASFLGAKYSAEERYRRRISKIVMMEEKYGNGSGA